MIPPIENHPEALVHYICWQERLLNGTKFSDLYSRIKLIGLCLNDTFDEIDHVRMRRKCEDLIVLIMVFVQNQMRSVVYTLRKMSGRLIETSKLDYNKTKLKNAIVLLAYQLDLRSRGRCAEKSNGSLEIWLKSS